MNSIARQLKLDRKTVRRFAVAVAPIDLLRREGPRARALDAYQPYLARRWREGQHVAKVLFNEIGGLGYRGSVRSVARYVTNWRTNKPPAPAYALLPVRARSPGYCCAGHLIWTKRSTFCWSNSASATLI